MSKPDVKYLELFHRRNIPRCRRLVRGDINLNAILNLPKGTEHFVSDIHGEDEAFSPHSEQCVGRDPREGGPPVCEDAVYPGAHPAVYADLLSRPQARGAAQGDRQRMVPITLYRMIEVCRLCASKYTRSKVRKALPKDFEYIIDELLHTFGGRQRQAGLLRAYYFHHHGYRPGGRVYHCAGVRHQAPCGGPFACGG